MKKVFCPECREYVMYRLEKETSTQKLKGVDYSFESEVAYCENCDSELYIDSLSDANLKALYDVYRLKNNIISLEKIVSIPEKYNIGKRPLSLMLGWGELTYSRYCSGDLPSKQYSDILNKIYDDPSFYLEALRNGKDSIKPVAYEKSMKRSMDIINSNLVSASKIDDAVKYLLQGCEDITHLALQKMLYYTQGFWYAFNNYFLFSDDCEAWVHGPVFREIYNKYRCYDFESQYDASSNQALELTCEEKVLLDNIISSFGCYSGKVLERFTHNELPWFTTREGLKPADATNRIIDKNVIGNYFLKVKDKYKMFQPTDINEYSKDMLSKCIK